MKVLEVNDNDIYGKIFNGYTIMEELNKKKDYKVRQLVTNKVSNNPHCKKLFPTVDGIGKDYYLHKFEHDIMSTHSLLSVSTLRLKKNKYYKKSDLVHYHQIHNNRLSLPTLFEMAKCKPTVISFHDPWFMTGRCVHALDCDKWQTGCKSCSELDTFFDLPYDNCAELWKIKSQLADTDADIIVHSKFMYDLAMKHPYIKNLRIHQIPLGIDMSKFNFELTKEEAKKKLNILPSDTVIFFREQKELKGTNYIVEALKKLKNKNSITLVTCSQTGLLKEIEDDFNIIELGVLEENEVLLCYNAADIFLMPSLGESFGMMAVEAMASGLPTIVFDNSALPDTTGAPEVGILVKNLDSDDLHDKIEYYLTHPEERQKRGNLSKEYVRKKYDFDTFINRVSDVYKEAYSKQKYKLVKRYKSNFKIDYNNDNVKKALYKLNGIYDEFCKEDTKPDFLKNESIDGNDIEFSDINVIHLIEKFNDFIYHNPKLVRPLEEFEENDQEDSDLQIDDSKRPKVSIIMPVYNGGKFISLAIDSALRQTYKNIEIIVVDDGSTDDTEQVCKAYGDKIRYIKKENGGVSTALNLGIEQMTGDYFSWLSHDDLYYPKKVEIEIDYLEKHNLVGTNTILYSNFTIIDEHGKLVHDIIFDSNDLNRDSAFSIIKGGIDGLTLLIPKKAFKDAGLFDKDLRCVQDYKLWFEMYKKGYKFIHIPNILAATRVHSESVTNTNPKVVTEGNEFWLEVVKYFSDEKKKELYGSIYNYYFNLYNFFNYGPYDKTFEYCEEKCKYYEEINKEKTQNTKVSIVLPFHNNVSSATRALQSALNQTHKNIEIILINNCSSDDTSKIEEIANANADVIKYIKFDQEESIASAWNEGIKMATSDYIAFLEPFSVFDITKIELQLAKMIPSEDVISHTAYYERRNNKTTFIDNGYLTGKICYSLMNEYYVDISTVMIYKPYFTQNNITFMDKNKSAIYVCFYMDALKNTRLLSVRNPLSLIYRDIENLDEEERGHYVLKYILDDIDAKQFVSEVSKLLYSYAGLINSNVDYGYDFTHHEELGRYAYIQSTECQRVTKIRKIYNKIVHKKPIPVYTLSTYSLEYSTLNKMYKKIKSIQSKFNINK